MRPPRNTSLVACLIGSLLLVGPAVALETIVLVPDERASWRPKNLLGFLRPSAGRASVFGMDCWHDSHRIKQEVGYLPSDLRLYPWMTAESAEISLRSRRDWTRWCWRCSMPAR